METRADVLPPSLSLPASHGWCHLHHRERGSPMKNRKREICTSGSVRDEAGQPPHLLGRNLAQRLERDWSGVSGAILEGIDEILTVTRLGLPKELRRSLACTNIVENMVATVRRVCRNVKRWRSASMALRLTAAAMQEAAKGFRRLKAYKQLPALRAALQAHQMKSSTHRVLARQANAA